MKKLSNIHPGEILMNEFLIPLNICNIELSTKTSIPQIIIDEIINEKRSVTIEIAMGLANYFGNSSEFWIGLQKDYDKENDSKNKSNHYEK
jgi:addiction module HigA family antidote